MLCFTNQSSSVHSTPPSHTHTYRHTHTELWLSLGVLVEVDEALVVKEGRQTLPVISTHSIYWLLFVFVFLTVVRMSVTADECLWYHLKVAAKWSRWHRANQLAPADSNWHTFICTLHACVKCFLYNTVAAWCKYGDVPSKYCLRQIKEDYAWMTMM